MLHNEHINIIILTALLASTPIATITAPNVYAQQEMTPTHTFETQEEYTKLAISADGKHIAAISNTTEKLSMFNRTNMLWSTHVPGIRSIAMSQNASLIAAGANSGLYLFNNLYSTPQMHYNLKYENPSVAVSDNGSTIAYAATSTDQSNRPTTTLYICEQQNQNPTWNTTLQGTLESVSTSSNGSYITISTSHPGALHLFSKPHSTPLWTYSFGERSGAAKISTDGNYIIATGGNQTGERSLRVYRFQPQSPQPNYIKIISELPPTTLLSVTSQGSIFTLSLTESKRLIFFNLNLPPYGYGPGSVLNISLPTQPTSTSMSAEGKYTAIGTDAGIYIYEYADKELDLTKQYTTHNPIIADATITANGKYLAATATRQQNNKQSIIYLFEVQEIRNGNPNLWFQIITSAIIIVVGLTALAYFLRRKQKPQKPSSTNLVAAATKTESGEFHA